MEDWRASYSVKLYSEYKYTGFKKKQKTNTLASNTGLETFFLFFSLTRKKKPTKQKKQTEVQSKREKVCLYKTWAT